MMLKTYDPKVTKLPDTNSYRTHESFFSCDDEWSRVALKFDQLEVPRWWAKHYQTPLTDQSKNYSQVYKIAFGNSEQSPVGVTSNLKVKSLRLVGQSTSIIILTVILVLALWAVWGLWLMNQYTEYVISNVKERLKHDRPIVAYHAVDNVTKVNKEQNSVLEYLATQYSNSELSANMAIAELGLNRTKINDILKEEVGMTFSAYLNKLRLTESARLLREQEVTIAEIAYAVGYNNPSYFNTLFKKEYGCTPKMFKKHISVVTERGAESS